MYVCKSVIVFIACLSVTGVEEDRIQEIIDAKLEATARGLARAQGKDIFPLIGYSYYEYSQALRDEDPYSALLFAEYANEMSNLDIYFDKPKSNVITSIVKSEDAENLIAFVFGLIAGGIIVTLFWKGKRRAKKRKSPKTGRMYKDFEVQTKKAK